MNDLHQPVMLIEALESLAIQPDGVVVDGTFGRGGHSRGILDRLGPSGRLLAIDRDLAAIESGRRDPRFRDDRVTFIHGPFSRLDEWLDAHRIEKIDGLFLDLGVSSPQLDDPSRGMSFRFDAPLDMRMDTTQGETAAEFLARADQHELEEVIHEYGEERFAHALAKALVTARQQCRISSTRELAALVAKAVRTREPGQHPATRTFQALRIYINRELEELSVTLPLALKRLASGGRLVVISFHSLEDRIVKRFMREASCAPSFPKAVPIRRQDIPSPVSRRVGKPIRPSELEVKVNPRAHSAMMRVLEKLS